MASPLETERKAGVSEPLSVLRYPKSPLAESFRAVRTNLHYLGVDKPHRKLLVTSAFPKEGKSTSVANLGVTIALGGSRTLVIDADLRRPSLHRFFRVSSKVGLTSVLIGEADLGQAVQATELPELFVLPSGPLVMNPAELLGSRRLAEMVRTLQDQYDFLVFDSPPVAVASDPLVLVDVSDGVVLVVRSGAVARQAVMRAKQQLEGVKANILGVVVNAFDHRREAYYYSPYYYYYYYSYGKGDAYHNGDKER